MKDFEHDFPFGSAHEIDIDARPIAEALGISLDEAIDLGRSSTVPDDFMESVALKLLAPNGFNLVRCRAEAISARRNATSILPPLMLVPRLVFSAALVAEKGAEAECHAPLFHEDDPDAIFDGYIFFDMRKFPRVGLFRIPYLRVERFLREEGLSHNPFTETEFDLLVKGRSRS